MTYRRYIRLHEWGLERSYRSTEIVTIGTSGGMATATMIERA
jgi:hypothetical protein